MEFKVTPTFERTMNVTDRVVCFRGGTRSGKSYAMMQKVCLWLWTGRISGLIVKDGVFSVTRSTLPALKATVLADFIAYLFELDIYKYIRHTKTTHEFVFQGRKVVFFSLDDEHKLRGKSHDFLWINECTDIDFLVFNQGIMRLKHQMFLDYNPQGENWVKTEIEEKRIKEKGDVHLDISVYTDNPFLPQLLIDEILHLKNVDDSLWRIYTLGEWVSLKGLIFPQVKLINEIPMVGKSYFGMDWGYNDPNVLVKVVIDKDNLYVDCLLYRRQMLIDEMATEIKRHVRPGDVVWCDAAEPRTIEEMKRRGIQAKPARKGRDSVMQGLGFIKQHYIHLTSSSVDSKKEFDVYKWAEDKDGRLIDSPITMYNHTADAMRYAINRALGSKLEIL